MPQTTDSSSAVDIKPRSREVTDGLEKAAARGMLRAVGMDDDDFATREWAMDELARLGRAAAGALRKALAANPTPELRRRAQELLQRLPEEGTVVPATAQVLRGLEALEAINTKESREVLEAVAEGAPDAEATREARDALRRLGHNPRP